jgi:regulator of PEP synthase PpsR (kinase-PPPase family)
MSEVFVVSDGTGQTATQTLAAALTQFGQTDVNLQVRRGVRTAERIASVVREAADAHGFIVHTLVSQDLRDAMVREGRQHNVETIDLMGPLLARLSRQLANSPSERPGLFQHVDDSYFRTLSTLEFAIRHDDGLRADELEAAEIILVGVSRTFKTPLSVYLAFKGWYAANVPVVLDLSLPESLYALPPGRVFGVTMGPRRLATLRRSRHEHLRGETGDYAELHHVQRELHYARVLFSRAGWPAVDVTDKPIEEIASEIVALRAGIAGR